MCILLNKYKLSPPFSNIFNQSPTISKFFHQPPGCIGSLMVSSVVGRFGRKNGLMVNNLFSLLAAIFMGISKPINVFWTILVGRVFIGIFAGQLEFDFELSLQSFYFLNVQKLFVCKLCCNCCAFLLYKITNRCFS